MQLGCRLTFHYYLTAGDNTINKQTQVSEVNLNVFVEFDDSLIVHLLFKSLLRS